MADEELGPFGEKYELIEKIASGGMADVYRARAKGMAGFEKILVIKRIQPELAKDEEFKRLFIDEARITVTIRHVNIVQVFDIDEYKQVFMTRYVRATPLPALSDKRLDRFTFVGVIYHRRSVESP